MSLVRHISTDTIHPATHTDSTQRIDLTPWDLNLLAVYPIQKGLLFNSKPTESAWLSDLKNSFSTTLDHYYLLAGRFAFESNLEDNSVSLFIQCDNEGAEFIHATADISVSDVTTPLYVPEIVHDLFSLNGYINFDENLSQPPLLSVQVTELIDGVFIGFTMNHLAADISSFWRFINSWSEICRTGSNEIQHPPVLDRGFISDKPILIPASNIDKLIHSSSLPEERILSLPKLDERILHYAADNITKLMENAGSDISSLQAVIGHVWAGIARAKNLDWDDEVRYRMSMDIRTTLKAPLSDEYFGNSVFSRSVIVNVGELVFGELAVNNGIAAKLLSQAVNSQDNEKLIRGTWGNFVKEPRFISVEEYVGDVLITRTSPQFDIYGNDFGWGSPIAMRSGRANKYDGKMCVYPGAVEGSIEVEACLAPETMKALEEDYEFLEFVGAAGSVA